MKVKNIGRMIVPGTMLALAAACSNPLTSSLGIPALLKGHSTHWYASTASASIGAFDED